MLNIIIGFVALAISVLGWLYWKYWDGIYKHWERKGVPHIPGNYPYGSSEELTTGATFVGNLMDKLYHQFAGVPYFGIYRGFESVLVVRDPEMVKLVLAKEFTHFRNRLGFRVKDDDILAKHLFMLEGDKWRSLRVRMSPVFSSGKLKAMFPLFVQCAEALDELLLSIVDTDIVVKNYTKRFSMDVICSCAFGLDGGAIKNTGSLFEVVASKPPQVEGGILYRTLLLIKKYFPFLNIVPPLRITHPETEEYMMKIVKDTVEHREKTGFKRNDFIDLLIQLKDKGILNEELTEEDLKDKNIEPIVMTLEVMAAQCYVFFTAGYGTSSTVKSLCLYELALHPEIQERLHQEITSTIDKHGGITYQALNEMEYLDMVVSETMRVYPTLYALTRICTSPFTMPSGHKIDKGQKVLIPVWSLHHDPEHFPNPEKFDPERFSQENKQSRHPFVYLPFGEGPRICIGMRFGLLQTKMGIVTFLRKYKVEPCEETPIPLTLAGSWHPLTRTEKSVVLRLTKRNS